jgi:hypothetical protein
MDGLAQTESAVTNPVTNQHNVDCVISSSSICETLPCDSKCKSKVQAKKLTFAIEGLQRHQMQTAKSRKNDFQTAWLKVDAFWIASLEVGR